MSVKLHCPQRISREISIPCPRQLLLIPGILRLVALSVPSLCLSCAVCSTACISLCLLLRTSVMVGRSLSNNPTRSFYFEIINYLNLFMAYAKIFFSPNKSIWKFCVHYPTHYSNCDIFILIWYFAVTRSLQTQVKRVIYFVSQFEGTSHLGREDMVAGNTSRSVSEEQGAEKRQKLELGYNMVLKVTLCDPLLLMTLHLLAVLQTSETAPAARGHICMSLWGTFHIQNHKT